MQKVLTQARGFAFWWDPFFMLLVCSDLRKWLIVNHAQMFSRPKTGKERWKFLAKKCLVLNSTNASLVDDLLALSNNESHFSSNLMNKLCQSLNKPDSYNCTKNDHSKSPNHLPDFSNSMPAEFFHRNGWNTIFSKNLSTSNETLKMILK